MERNREKNARDKVIVNFVVILYRDLDLEYLKKKKNKLKLFCHFGYRFRLLITESKPSKQSAIKVVTS